MQQLSHTILLSGTVYVWHFVVGYLGEVQAYLQDREREREIVKKNEERGRLKKNECWNAAERGHTPRERSPERRLHR